MTSFNPYQPSFSLGLVNLAGCFQGVGREEIAGVHDESGVLEDEVAVVGVVVGGQQEAVGLGQVFLGQRGAGEGVGVFAGGAQGRDVGVVVADLGPLGLEQFHQLVGGDSRSSSTFFL